MLTQCTMDNFWGAFSEKVIEIDQALMEEGESEESDKVYHLMESVVTTATKMVPWLNIEFYKTNSRNQIILSPVPDDLCATEMAQLIKSSPGFENWDLVAYRQPFDINETEDINEYFREVADAEFDVTSTDDVAFCAYQKEDGQFILDVGLPTAEIEKMEEDAPPTDYIRTVQQVISELLGDEFVIASLSGVRFTDVENLPQLAKENEAQLIRANQYALAHRGSPIQPLVLVGTMIDQVQKH